MFELNHQSDHCVYRLDLTVWLAVQQASQEPGFLLEHAVLEVALDVLLTGVRVLLFSYGCKQQEIKCLEENYEPETFYEMPCANFRNQE